MGLGVEVAGSSSESVALGDCSDVELTAGLPQLVVRPTTTMKMKAAPIIKTGFNQSF